MCLGWLVLVVKLRTGRTNESSSSETFHENTDRAVRGGLRRFIYGESVCTVENNPLPTRMRRNV